MDFYAVLDQVLDLLRQRGRVTYNALKRQFDLDEACLQDLKDEIIAAQRVATLPPPAAAPAAVQARAALTMAIDLYRAMDMTFWLPQAEVALAQVA